MFAAISPARRSFCRPKPGSFSHICNYRGEVFGARVANRFAFVFKLFMFWLRANSDLGLPDPRDTHFIFSSLATLRGEMAEISFGVGVVLGGIPVWSNFFIRFIRAL